jgi:hypothetical protein
MSAYLVATSGHTATLPEWLVRVGSDPQADLPITGDLGLAPLHYEIMPNEHGHWIRGLTPGFPLLINGRPVEVALLQQGDVITSGALDLSFRRDDPAQAPPPPPAFVPAPVMDQSFIQTAPSAPEPVPEPASGGYRPPTRSEDQDDERYAHLSDAERRKALLMEQTEERTRRHLEELKAEQNYSGAFMAALVTLAVAVFAYGAITGLGLKVLSSPLPGWAMASAGS